MCKGHNNKTFGVKHLVHFRLYGRENLLRDGVDWFLIASELLLPAVSPCFVLRFENLKSSSAHNTRHRVRVCSIFFSSFARSFEHLTRLLVSSNHLGFLLRFGHLAFIINN